MQETIHLDAPNIGENEKAWLGRAVDSGYVSTVGPFVKEFEQRFAAFLGGVPAVSTQSGTAALHGALHELGIGPGDEVILPTLTFAATVNAVLVLGAVPVFADVDAATWTLDPAWLEELGGPRTRAVIPVHLYGSPCRMDAILGIAQARGWRVVEDATESLGSRLNGRPLGTFGDFGCYSFNGNKTLTTGGGGMVVGAEPERIRHLGHLVNQARDPERGFFHTEMGFNYRMTNLEAAFGLAQLERLDFFLARKRRFAEIYRQELGGLEQVHFQEAGPGADPIWWLTCLTLDAAVDLEGLQQALASEGIPTRRVFMPLSRFPHCQGYRSGGGQVAGQVFERGLCLPSSTLNSDLAVEFVCDRLRRALR